MNKIVKFLNTEEKTTRGQQLIVCGCLFGLWALNNSLIKKSNEDRRQIHNYKEITEAFRNELRDEKERNYVLKNKLDEFEKEED